LSEGKKPLTLASYTISPRNVKRNLDFLPLMGYAGVWACDPPVGPLGDFYRSLEDMVEEVRGVGLLTVLAADSSSLPPQKFEQHLRYLLDLSADYYILDVSPAARPYQLRRLLQSLEEPPRNVALGFLPDVTKWMEWTDGVDAVALHSLLSSPTPEGKTLLLPERWPDSVATATAGDHRR
jgi:hypothetical protein